MNYEECSIQDCFTTLTESKTKLRKIIIFEQYSFLYGFNIYLQCCQFRKKKNRNPDFFLTLFSTFKIRFSIKKHLT